MVLPDNEDTNDDTEIQTRVVDLHELKLPGAIQSCSQLDAIRRQNCRSRGKKFTHLRCFCSSEETNVKMTILQIY